MTWPLCLQYYWADGTYIGGTTPRAANPYVSSGFCRQRMQQPELYPMLCQLCSKPVALGSWHVLLLLLCCLWLG